MHHAVYGDTDNLRLFLRLFLEVCDGVVSGCYAEEAVSFAGWDDSSLAGFPGFGKAPATGGFVLCS